jgi:RES domain-containing protein
VILWRISNHLSLTGDGALRASGRWHTRGRRIVYCAQTPAAALLEILVHSEIKVRDLPASYRLLRIEAPENAAGEQVRLDQLPIDWVARSDVTRVIGDEWLATSRSPLLLVPSAVVPETLNVLLNPIHSDAGRIVIAQVSDHVIDPRLLE